MSRLGDYLRSLLPARQVRSKREVERLRIDFKSRYHSFRRLLEANKQVLELMAELSQTLRGTQPYGMTYGRARCTRIATQIWQMIKHLNDLAPEQYEDLRERFEMIRGRINEALATKPHVVKGELVLPLWKVGAGAASHVGGKMARLGELRSLGAKIPDGFVVTARGFWCFVEHNQLQTEIDRQLQAAGAERLDDLYEVSTEVRRLILRAELPQELREAILEQYRCLERAEGAGVAVAVRSSGLGEDVPGASFAGQHHSELNVSRESLLEMYKLVVASKYSLPAMTYRLSRGIRDESVAMCVGVMHMVDAVAGGVLYTRNPVNTVDDSILINSNWGLPLSVVEGSSSADLYVVARGENPQLRHREIGDKTAKAVSRPGEGVRNQEIDAAERHRASLTDEQVEELARLGLRLEQQYGAPQDIEWAIDREGAVVLLQRRELELRLTSARADPEPGPEPAVESVLLQGGLTASPGAAAGPVFCVRRESDALQFPDGAVLVTVQPSPLWAPLLSRAAALVAEQGTVAGHLATVAREFGVPALFGVPEAIRNLPGGETITVDADGRRVFRGRAESALAGAKKPVNLMDQSPVQRALSAAARHITPLNLVDPDSPEFTPGHCQTFHDIARFGHEKAVLEMFRFGRDHHFPERSSKQLHHDVPMQWWVLNLDDGFKQEVEGKYVRLDSIACVPMLAIWEGIVAVTWEGPPPLDGRGFMSVMLEATRNTALTTGRKSSYADRNYFMISKNYCCLNSRLGAHFSIIEALIGERTGDDYVSFQFKGGAADYQRRLMRVDFVKEILEEYGFRVELNEDNVVARLDGHDHGYMTDRLKILGYLNIHTRQLDMIMLNPGAVDYYRKKIHADIEGMLSAC